jgi:hypothetical protein
MDNSVNEYMDRPDYTNANENAQEIDHYTGIGASSRNLEEIMQALRSTLIRAGSALTCARPPASCTFQGILGSRSVSWGQISSPRPCSFRNVLSTMTRTDGNNLHAKSFASFSMPIKRFSTTTVESAKQPMFAVIIVGGKQYKVCENDCIVTEKLIGKRVGTGISSDIKVSFFFQMKIIPFLVSCLNCENDQ